MTFTVLLFGHRKESLTPSEFKEYLENTHIPLLRKLFGPLFPLSHTRRYVYRSEEKPHSATVFTGTQDDFDYDVVSELVFESQDAFQAFFAKYQDPELAVTITEDESAFLDSAKMRAVLLGETTTTKRE